MTELVGNDIEVNGEKVARVFDIRASLKDELHMAIERSNVSEEDIQNKIKTAFNNGYNKGRENGFDEGHQDGYAQRGREEED
jgi:flagellar biosynthesis/type III secretory pathway protein FliH